MKTSDLSDTVQEALLRNLVTLFFNKPLESKEDFIQRLKDDGYREQPIQNAFDFLKNTYGTQKNRRGTGIHTNGGKKHKKVSRTKPIHTG